MTQPSFVPIAEADQVRPVRHLHVPGGWTPRRPAEVAVPVRAPRPGMGTQGPDQGFAMGLARRFADRLHLAGGEEAEDVMVGCALVAARRAGLSGRAPCVHDLTAAFSLWGFLGDAAPEMLDTRCQAFRGASHDYTVQRALVDGVPEDRLRSSPAAAGAREAGPQEEFGAPAGDRAG